MPYNIKALSVQPLTPLQMASILGPWRTAEQRQLAINPGALGSVWLRTCYEDGTDNKHPKLVANVDMYNESTARGACSMTQYCIIFGDHWERILDYVPELVGCADERVRIAILPASEGQKMSCTRRKSSFRKTHPVIMRRLLCL